MATVLLTLQMRSHASQTSEPFTLRTCADFFDGTCLLSILCLGSANGLKEEVPVRKQKHTRMRMDV